MDFQTDIVTMQRYKMWPSLYYEAGNLEAGDGSAWLVLEIVTEGTLCCWATVTKKGRGKLDFQPISQVYIELTEATAHLEHILGVIRKRWGAEYTLVTTDRIELEESLHYF